MGRILIVSTIMATGWVGHAFMVDPPATGSISGRIVTVDGLPVPKAAVWCQERRDVLLRTESDDQGRFTLGPIEVLKKTPSLTYPIRPTVWAETPELARDRVEGIALFAGATHDIGDLSLASGSRVSGRAVDGKGEPLAGVNIVVRSWRHILGHTIDTNGPDWKLTSAADGSFISPALPAGMMNLRLAAPGKVTTTSSKQINPSQALIELSDLKMDQEVATSGIVVDKKTGNGVRDVSVYADYDYENAVTTDKEGKFQLPGLGENVKTITLEAKSYFAPKPIPIEGDRQALKLPIQQAYQIKGQVVDSHTGELVEIAHAQLCKVRKDLDGSTVLQG